MRLKMNRRNLIKALPFLILLPTIVAMIFAGCQSQELKPIESTPETLVVETDFRVCGTLEVADVSIDECPATYQIMRETVFTVTDATGKSIVLQGPLVIEGGRE